MKTRISLIAPAAALMAFAVFADRPVSQHPEVAALIERADSGDAKAQYELSGILDSGFADLQPDSLEATHYLTMAADAGYAPALNYLGFRYYNGQGGLTKDIDKGIRLIGDAAARGDARAANNLGWLLLQDESGCNDAEAAKWFAKAADAGVPAAMAQLADLYKEGRGVETDTLKAAELYTAAIEAGLMDAQLKLLAMMHDRFLAMDADEALDLGLSYYTQRGAVVGVTLFEIAADKGSAQALALLGDAYSRARGVAYDHNLSLYYFYKAALEGDASAQFVIAELLDMFPDALEDLPEDEALTIIADPQLWYDRAASAGIRDAATATTRLLTPTPSH